MDKLCRTDECVTIGKCKISPLLFADNLVLLASSESGLQHTFNKFVAARDIAGMKIITSKTEVFHLLRNFVQFFLQVGAVSWREVEKFKYLGAAFTSNGRQDEELDVASGKANAMMRAVQCAIRIQLS